ncbi:MAG: hypothetical protein HYX76_05955 [Acidobacteria bacterium]|nr:hypothetical protein [Acidobacteriota bacterium]
MQPRDSLRLMVGAFLAFGLIATPCAADDAIFDGRPSFREGHDLGYYVWKEGRTWHVRWTTFGAMRRFTGHVVSEGGRLESLKRIDVEEERKVICPGRAPRVVRGPRGRVRGVSPGRAPVVAERTQDRIEKEGDRRIQFTAQTDDDIDGFDFTVGDQVHELRFTLEIDGKSRPADVDVGRGNQHPATNPFLVTIR